MNIKYGIVIDLNMCIRCRTCMVACKVQNKVPPFEQNRVEHYRIRPVEWEEGKYPKVKRIFIPVLCMQCDNPACQSVCPVNAISKRKDGLVVIDKNRCIACGSCTKACPYGVPYLLQKSDKCDYCAATRLDKGEKESYCAKSCVPGAIMFGDLNDPQSQVAKIVSSGKAKTLCPEFGTQPQLYYIPPRGYEVSWARLHQNKLFLSALKARKKDLARPKSASKGSPFADIAAHGGDTTLTPAALIAGGLGTFLVSLDKLGERKRKVAALKKEKEMQEKAQTMER